MSARVQWAVPKEPHWVVVSLSRGKHPAPVEGANGWRYLRRHATEDSAIAECARLAEAHPGDRFSVYASGISCKVEKAEPADQASPIADVLA